MSAGHGQGAPANRKVALFISVLALVLAFSEVLGKAAQTSGLSYNIEASNLWAFFQAKTIRQTTLRTAAGQLEAQFGDHVPEAAKKRIDEWRQAADRYESQPETREGRKELAARAKAAEKKRDRALAAYHQFEVGSGAMQIAILVASAEIIAGVPFMLWIAGGMGIVGVVFCFIGMFAPTALHLF